MTKSAEELEQIYVEGDFDLMGTAVFRRGYEHWSPEWQLTRLQGKIDEDRLEALDAGAKPTASELDVAWRESLAGDREDEFATGILFQRNRLEDGTPSVRACARAYCWYR